MGARAIPKAFSMGAIDASKEPFFRGNARLAKGLKVYDRYRSAITPYDFGVLESTAKLAMKIKDVCVRSVHNWLFGR